ncbi:hypothetical protein [uncultured Tenacibaculum sp.]|nr:hypothetical protein [uncultured Tenacibaculum sp.]
MKNSILNLGKELKKAEQQKVNGGSQRICGELECREQKNWYIRRCSNCDS